jgi:hypothetical protein
MVPPPLPKLLLAAGVGLSIIIVTTGETLRPQSLIIASIVNGVRYTTAGARIDAHSGTILRAADGLFYWYGETYGCGFHWQDPQTAYCGAQVYRSSDLVRWQGPWQLFDASTPLWQDTCMHQDGAPGSGCFRPKVVHNSATHLFILWLNTPDGYRVFTSPGARGPFSLAARPNLQDAGIGDWRGNPRAQDGDEGLFVDSRGAAWLVWSRGGRLLEERLDAAYTSGAGPPKTIGGFPQFAPWAGAEAPSMFEHGGRYYIAMSLPRCPYCTGATTAIERAPSPDGPWSYDGVVTWDSCGGQPNEVDQLAPGTLLWSSDQWLRDAEAGKWPRLNETLATQAWEPIQFQGAHVAPIDCGVRFTLSLG